VSEVPENVAVQEFRVPLRITIRSLLVLVAALVCVVPAAVAAPTAKVTVSKVSVKGAKVTVTGSVRLPHDTAAIRHRTRVALTLVNAKGKKESFAAKLDAKRRFSATKTTKLTGALGLTAIVKIGGKRSGAVVTRKRAVTIAAPTGRQPGTTNTPAGGSSGGAGSVGGGSSGSGGSAPAVPVQGTPLVGLFRLDAGAQSASGALAGTYFQMLGGSSESPLPNGDSTALDKNYTLLRPGTDGGLRTDVYQPAPSPAFAGTVTGQPTGNALANRIVQPQKFFQIDFSIVTGAVDAQTGQADPLPLISALDGKLTGQTTAWVAQWNGLSFNQGSPKPDGTSPGHTQPVSGTYDAATGRFVLQWKSLIVGGPFDGYTGRWHLEGTFVPAAS
jgi:hypothetical protein